MGTHSVVYHAFPGVLEFLAQTVRLQDVDDTEEEEQPLAASVPRGNAARPVQNV